METLKKLVSTIDKKVLTPEKGLNLASDHHDFIHNQNRFLLGIYTIRLVMTTILFNLKEITIHRDPAQQIFILAILVFLATCRRYFFINQIIITLFFSAMVQLSTYAIPYAATLMIQINISLGFFVLFITDSLKCGTFYLVCQFVGSPIFMKPNLEEFVKNTSPEEFAEKVLSINRYLMIGIFMVYYVLYTFIRSNREKVYQRTEELQEAYQKLEHFIQGFSHEIRNPLNSLKGNVYLAMEEYVKPQVKKYLQNAEVCTEVVLQLINNILDTGKADLGRVDIVLQKMDVRKTFSKIWTISNHIIQSKRLQGCLRISPSVPKQLKLDQTRMSQVLLNLVSNAIKFTEKGSVKIRIDYKEGIPGVSDSVFEPIPYDEESTDEQKTVCSIKYMNFEDLQRNLLGGQRHGEELDERSRGIFLPKGMLSAENSPRNRGRLLSTDASEELPPTEGVLKISVVDTGCGMSREDVGKLFQKFSQVSQDEAQRQKGTGLGLFITKEIIKALNGEVRAYSRLGEGTSMVVCIPVNNINSSQDQL